MTLTGESLPNYPRRAQGKPPIKSSTGKGMSCRTRQAKARYKKKLQQEYPAAAPEIIQELMEMRRLEWDRELNPSTYFKKTRPEPTPALMPVIPAAHPEPVTALALIPAPIMPVFQDQVEWNATILRREWRCPYLNEWAVLINTIKYLMLFAPRGHGKTELIASLVIRMLLEVPNVKILLLTSTNRAAMQLFMYIIDELQNNEEITSRYGEDRVTWSNRPVCSLNVQGYLHTARTHSLQIASFDANIVGLHPTIIIMEDIIQEGFRNDLSQEWLVHRFRSIVENMATEETRITIIGTRKSPEDFYSQIMQGYTVHTYKAIEVIEGNYPTAAEVSFNDRTLKKPIAELGIFRTLGCPSWSTQRLLVQRVIDPQGFESEMQNNPLPDTGLYFDMKEWQEQVFIPPEQWANAYMAVDPALGKGATSDYTAILVGVIHENTLYIVDGLIQRGLNFNDLKETILTFQKKWKARTVFLETNNFQVWLQQEITRTSWCPIHSIEHKGRDNKLIRLDSLKGWFAQGKVIVHPHCQPFEELKREYRLYDRTESNSTRHDDALDALEILLSNVGNYLVHRFSKEDYGQQ